MKKYILLLLIAFAFTSGGCGGSSSSLQVDSPEEDTAPKISAPFDSDGDGVPDIFGYYLDGWSDGQDDPADEEAYTVPYLNYIDSSDTDIDGTFTARIRLTQGHEYVLRYSHSGRPLTESYLDFAILTPDYNELLFDFGFELDSADTPAVEIQEEESITVSADDVEFKEGTGFYASSGIKALTESAFQNFVLPTPQTGGNLPVMTDFKTDEIITEEEHTREQELEDMSTFVLCKNALGDREMTVTNVRLAQISKNVIINYDLLEYQPRMVDVNTLQFSSDALSLLNSNYKEFREEFGDYFVAGYTWGMRFRAVIAVTCDNRSVLDKVCSQIRSMASKAQSGASYSSELQEIESLARWNDVDISVEGVTTDSKGPHKTALSLRAVAGELSSFSQKLQTATKNDYVRLKACFRRFREVPAAKSIIPAYLPISQNHFNAIVEMNKTIFRTRCIYNALMSIPAKHLVDGDGKRQEWKREFDDLKNETKNQLNYICDSEYQTNDYRSRFQRLHENYSELCERYIFYRRLMNEQKSQTRSFSDTDEEHDGSISGGFRTYDQSSIVMKDYGEYANALHTNFTHKKEKKFLV